VASEGFMVDVHDVDVLICGSVAVSGEWRKTLAEYTGRLDR